MSVFFGGNKKNEEKSAVNEALLSILASSLKITGDVIAEGDIRIEGTVVGNVICKSRLVIGSQGFIQGLIDSDNATIAGKVEGTVVIRDTLNLAESAVISGDIITEKMIVQAGAIFTGGCKMGKEAQEIIAKNYPRPEPNLIKNE